VSEYILFIKTLDNYIARYSVSSMTIKLVKINFSTNQHEFIHLVLYLILKPCRSISFVKQRLLIVHKLTS